MQVSCTQKARSYLNKMTGNVCSLLRKLPDLHEVITEYKSDIVVATETWLDSEINDAKVNIPDYIFFSCDRSRNRIDGEVALIIQKRSKPQPDTSNL